ncbi:hypothetical protein EON65_17865, partial [archaeon]
MVFIINVLMSSKKKDKRGGQSNLASVGFISFSDVTGTNEDNTEQQSTTAPISSNASPKAVPVYQGSHAELGMHCKKVLKKDQVTKVKALQEMASIITVEAAQDSDLIPGFLPYFSFLFPKIALENEWRVRERFCQLLQSILLVDKKSLISYMKEIIGPWWQMLNDSSNEVKQAYCTAFQGAFAPRKRLMLVSQLTDPILNHAVKFALIQPQELKEINVGMSEEELTEKLERLIISNFNGLSELLKVLYGQHN